MISVAESRWRNTPVDRYGTEDTVTDDLVSLMGPGEVGIRRFLVYNARLGGSEDF